MIYAQTTKQWLKDLIYIEMLARTGKCILWKNLRCVIYNDKMEFDANVKSHAENGKASVDQNYRKTQWGVVTIIEGVTTFLNYLLSYTQTSITYWNEVPLRRLSHR